MKIKTDELAHVTREQARKGAKQKEATKFGEILQRTMESTGTQAQKSTDAQAAAGARGLKTPGVESAGAVGSAGPLGAIGTVEGGEQGPILERVE